jgi:outer membrane protein assembly factor BamB
VWNVPAVDPKTGIIYFGTGNPSPGATPQEVAARTPGYPNGPDTNLYTDSIIALNSTNGKLVWYFQMVPGDQRDYDQGMPVLLFTTMIHGVSTEVVGAREKVGYFFVVSAKNGSMFYKTEIGIHENTNSSDGLFPGSQILPGSDGGVDTFSAYNPVYNLIFTTASNEPSECDIGTTCPVVRNATFYAIEASTGAIVWSTFLQGPDLGGGASTTNSLVFTSAGNHTFYALNASNGAVMYSRSDPSGGNAGVAYWSWGAPSIINGKLFVTTMGSSTGGMLEAWAVK